MESGQFMTVDKKQETPTLVVHVFLWRYYNYWRGLAYYTVKAVQSHNDIVSLSPRFSLSIEIQTINIFNMKKLKEFGMAIIAILLCVNFSSCGGDDDESEDLSNNGSSIKAEKLLGNWALTDYKGKHYDESLDDWVTTQEHVDINNHQEGDLRMDILPGIEKDELIWIEYEYTYDYYGGDELKWIKDEPTTAIIRGNYIISKDETSSQGKVIKLSKNTFEVLVKSNEETIYTFTRIK